MRIFRLLMFLPMALLLIAPANATTPTLVTGKITTGTGGTITGTRMAGGNTFSTGTVVAVFTGGIQGESVVTGTALVTSTGMYIAHGNGTFSGTIGGSEQGTAVARETCKGTVVSGTLVSVTCHLVLVGGTGGLAGLHGEGTFEGSSPSTATYSIDVHFDPA